MPAATVSSRREIHRHIRTLLQRRPPPPPSQPPLASSPPGVTVPSVVRSDSGSTSSKRRKKSQDDNDDHSCSRIKSNEPLGRDRDSAHEQEEGSHESASAERSEKRMKAPEDEAAASRTKTPVAPRPRLLDDSDDDVPLYKLPMRSLGRDSVHKQEEGIGKEEAVEEEEEAMDEDEEVESEDNVEDSESHSEDEVDVDDEELMEEDDNEDLGSDDSVHDHEEGSHEQASAVAAALVVPLEVSVRKTTRTTVANVCDADALECGVCFLTLRPPIFQCEVGHVVCSACRDKLEATGNAKCHVCGVAISGYHRRCHAMEHLLDCIRVPCPYAAHGCDTTPTYHGKESHRQVCPHAPCHCPGDSCGFIGSTAVLLDHFAGTHNWPCTTKVHAKEAFSIPLQDGFNFLLTDHASNDGDQDQPAANCSVPHRLFLLNVTQECLGRAISVLCIHPHASAAAANGAQQLPSTQCELVFSRCSDGNLCHRHYQSSVFKVVCTDLSNGLPNPEGCFQFFVPNTVLGVRDDKNSIQVKARIIN